MDNQVVDLLNQQIAIAQANVTALQNKVAAEEAQLNTSQSALAGALNLLAQLQSTVTLTTQAAQAQVAP